MRASVHRLDATFAALADPTRRTILTRLAKQESLVKDLAAPFDISLPAISKHLGVLEQAGLLARRREGQGMRCRLVAGPMKEAADWVACYRHFWEEPFGSLELHLTPFAVSATDRVTQETTKETRPSPRLSTPRRGRRGKKSRWPSPSSLNATFAALASPTRRTILTQLAERESSVTELAAPFHMSMPAVSKHLRVLGQAGLLSQTKEGRARRCRLAAQPMAEAAQWMAKYERFWKDRFAALEQHLNAASQSAQNEQ